MHTHKRLPRAYSQRRYKIFKFMYVANCNRTTHNGNRKNSNNIPSRTTQTSSGMCTADKTTPCHTHPQTAVGNSCPETGEGGEGYSYLCWDICLWRCVSRLPLPLRGWRVWVQIKGLVLFQMYYRRHAKQRTGIRFFFTNHSHNRFEAY